ncbi:MAG: GNAT family N-acetyltransferase [Acidobacteriota bacterium]
MKPILDFLGLDRDEGDDTPSSSTSGASVRDTLERLEALPTDRARFVASFAFVLSRVAHADSGFSSAETDAMERLVAERMGLSPDEAAVVVHVAKTQSRLLGEREITLVTREFSRLATRAEVLGLLQCLFAVSRADDDVSDLESREVEAIAAELGIEEQAVDVARRAFAIRHLSWDGELRPERPADHESIHALNVAAFEQDAEALVVQRLRAQEDPIHSLVAVEEGEIVGHVVFSTVTLEDGDGSITRHVALGPLAVAAEHRRRGIAGRLVDEGLRLSRADGAQLCFVLGDPAYYRRFGFEPAAARDLVSEYEGVGDAFMVSELRRGALERHRGLVRYSAAFEGV